MLLMNNNILLTNAVFEPHLYKNKEFPFIFHRNRMERPGTSKYYFLRLFKEVTGIR